MRCEAARPDAAPPGCASVCVVTPLCLGEAGDVTLAGEESSAVMMTMFQ